jgi:hypothetical protein
MDPDPEGGEKDAGDEESRPDDTNTSTADGETAGKVVGKTKAARDEPAVGTPKDDQK